MTTTMATDAGTFVLASVAFPDDEHNYDAITTHRMETAMLNNQHDDSYHDYIDHLKDQQDQAYDWDEPATEEDRAAAERRADWNRRTVEAAGKDPATHFAKFSGTVVPTGDDEGDKDECPRCGGPLASDDVCADDECE